MLQTAVLSFNVIKLNIILDLSGTRETVCIKFRHKLLIGFQVLQCNNIYVADFSPQTEQFHKE